MRGDAEARILESRGRDEEEEGLYLRIETRKRVQTNERGDAEARVLGSRGDAEAREAFAKPLSFVVRETQSRVSRACYDVPVYPDVYSLVQYSSWPQKQAFHEEEEEEEEEGRGLRGK